MYVHTTITSNKPPRAGEANAHIPKVFGPKESFDSIFGYIFQIKYIKPTYMYSETHMHVNFYS